MREERSGSHVKQQEERKGEKYRTGSKREGRKERGKDFKGKRKGAEGKREYHSTTVHTHKQSHTLSTHCQNVLSGVEYKFSLKAYLVFNLLNKSRGTKTSIGSSVYNTF